MSAVEEYAAMAARMRAAIAAHTPPGAVVVVADKGDPALGAHEGRMTLSALTDTDGRPAAYNPPSSRAVITVLNSVTRTPAYFVLPATASWWLDHYDELRVFLDEQCELVLAEPSTASIWALTANRASRPTRRRRVSLA